MPNLSLFSRRPAASDPSGPSRRARRGRVSLAIAASVAAVAAMVGVAPLADAAGDGTLGDTHTQRKVKVGVLVITMFEGETKPWLEKESLTRTVQVPGAYSPVTCDDKGLCVLTTGMGKSNAAATLSAVLSSPRLDLTRAHFVTAGIAGVSPKRGTLGFGAWARWIVDYDLGHHLLPETAPEVPHGYLPLDIDTSTFHLNEDLVDTAYRLTKDLELADSARSAEVRENYPGQEGQRPYVAECDTVTGDDWFSGADLSETAQYITGLRTEGKGQYCTTQMEDNATATVLARHGYLDRYLNVRTASNFDQPYPGQSVTDHLKADSGAYQTSVDNAYLLGSTVADYLLAHPVA